jgi:hypothetical protein
VLSRDAPRRTRSGRFLVGIVALAAIATIVVAVARYSPKHEPTIVSGGGSASLPVLGAGSENCSLASLKCDQFDSKGRSGSPLHELVFAARTNGYFEEAVCLAQKNEAASDTWLQGATFFEESNAWEALRCHENAVRDVEQSLRVRPKGRSGWKETCDWCRQIHGACTACAEQAQCPSNAALTKIIGAAMIARAPSGTNWSAPNVLLCTPMSLPAAGWYVIGVVQQDAPDRTFRFHYAINASNSAIVASSEGEQHSTHEACNLSVLRVDDHATAPSTVVTREDCVDNHERPSHNDYSANVSGNLVVLKTTEPLISGP